MRLLSTIIFTIFLLGNGVFAQNNDCSNAQVICDNNQISYNPSGPGSNDFSNPNNDPGCLLGVPIAEHQSAWYYFEFTNDMPFNSVLEFTITPNAGNGEDYDFAIYGPNPVCGDLGSPIRCTYANSACDYCPLTGLGNGETATSEGGTGTGYIAPLVVQPGYGYYLLVDNWLTTSTSGFDLDWGGTAAAFLNCDATPECDIVLTSTAPIELCAAPDPLALNIDIAGGTGNLSYTWTATNGGVAYLSATNVEHPTLSIPDGISGDFTYTLTVEDDICMKMIELQVDVAPPINLTITGEATACEGDAISLGTDANYATYQWSTGASTPTINVTSAGSYSLQVTDSNNCTSFAAKEVVFNPLPVPEITGDDNICSGESAMLDAGAGYTEYQWSSGGNTAQINTSTAGDYTVTVTDNNGCQGSNTKSLSVMPLPVFQISGDEIICKDGSTILETNASFNAYDWSTGASSPAIEVIAPGVYEVTVTDQNNCSSSESFEVTYSDMQLQFTQEDPACFGDDNGLIRIEKVEGGRPPYLYSWDSTAYDVKNFISNLVPGDYNLRVLDAAGCEVTKDFTIVEGFNLLLDLGEEQNLTLGDRLYIKAVVNVADEEIANISWDPFNVFDCSDCLEQDILPLKTTIVYVEVEDTRGCKASKELNVFVDKPRDVFVPSAFSPNDDGINDKLIVFAGKDVEQINHFTIFDRWGAVVFQQDKFQANDPFYGWKGDLQKKMNTGTYVYSAEVLFIDGVTKIYSGEIHLLR